MLQRARIDWIRAVAAGAGIGAAGIGAVYLVGWLSGAMTRHGFDEITVKANSALCLLLYGVSLALVSFGSGRKSVRRAALPLIAAALAVGAFTWLELLFGWDFGMDQFISTEAPGSLGGGHPNRMGPPGAMTYTVTGIAQLLTMHGKDRSVRIAQFLGLFVCLVALMGMLGYLYGVAYLYGAAHFTVVAWPATIGNFLLGIGLLFLRPREGLMAPVTAPDAAGTALRRLLAAAVAVPILLGWLQLKGESFGLYERYFGSSLLVLSWIVVFSFLVYRVGAWVSRSAAAVRESEDRLKAIFDNAGVGIVEVADDDRFIAVNDRICEMLGYQARQLLEMTVYELTAPEDRPLSAELNRRVHEGELARAMYDKRYLKRDGTPLWVHVNVSGVRDEHGNWISSINTIEEIEDRKRAEDSLREREQQLLLFLEHAPAALAMFDRNMHYLYASRRWLTAYGLGDRDLRGISHYDVFPELPEEWMEYHCRCMAGETLRADADRFQRSDGRVQWIRWEIRPWYDSLGKVGGIFIFSEDMTDAKRAEEDLQKTVAELERSNRELQQFAHVASHDLQEPLRTVASYTQLLQKRYRGQLDEKANSYIAYVVEAAERMSSLIRDLLEYSLVMTQEQRSRPVSMESALQRAVGNLAESIRESGAEVGHDPLPEVTGDGGQLVRLFQNLLENALKYRKKDVPLRVRVSAAREGGEWIFGVHDNGIGLEPQFYDRIFRMFKRLHQREEYDGTGMGLAICRKIVERHGGRIWVESTPGEGSTFYFSVPEKAGEADAS